MPKSTLFQEVCDKLRTEHKFSTVYYPRGNARVKNVHSFLKRTIAKYMNQHKELEWDSVIQLACFAFNSTESVDRLKNPFYLLHG